MFKLNGYEYTLEEITEAAKTAGVSVDDYIAKHKIESVEAFQNDPASAETNAGSIPSTVSQSEGDSSGYRLQTPDEIINDYQLPQQDIDAARTNAGLSFDKIIEGKFNNSISREEEGNSLTQSLQDVPDGAAASPYYTFLSKLAVKFITSDPVSEMIGGAYSGVTQMADKMNSGDIQMPMGMTDIESTYDLEEDRPSKFKPNSQIVQPKDLTDYNIYNNSKRSYARKKLRETNEDYNTPVTNKEVDLYIEENEDTKDFLQGTRTLFEDEKVAKAKKDFIIDKSRGNAIFKSDDQKVSEQAGLDKSAVLKERSSINIGTSENLAKEIIDVEKKLFSLINSKPQSQQEFDELKSTVKGLMETRKELVGAYGQVVNEQLEIGDEAKDLNAFLDAIGRNQGWLVNPIGSTVGGVFDMADNLDEFLDRLMYTPWEIIGDEIMEDKQLKGSWINSVVGAMQEGEDSGFGLKEAVKNMRQGLSEPISIADINGAADMWQWSANLVGSQAANTAVMLTTGGWALPLLGASSAGASFNSMQEEIDLYGAKYTPLEMYTVAFGTGLAEALSERITLGQLKRAKGFMARNRKAIPGGVNDYFKKLFTKQGVKNAAVGGYIYAKETFEEGFTEAVAGFSQRSLERYVLGKDVDLFEGMADEFVGGAFMSGFVYKSPGIAMNLYKAFQPADSNTRIGKLQIRNVEIGNILSNSPSMDGQIRKKLEEELQANATRVQQIMAKDFRNMDKMTQQEQNDLMAKESEIYKLRELYDTVNGDNSINEKDKAAILSQLEGEFKAANFNKTKILSEVNVREEITNITSLAESAGNQDFGPEAVGTGQAVEVFEDNDAFTKGTNITETNVEGTELSNGQIVLNKAQMLRVAMANGGNIGTGTHELLHKVLKSEFSKDPVRAKKLKKQFLKVLQSEDSELYDAVIAKADANYSPEYLEKNPDEYLTIFSSILKENNIEYSQAKDGVFKRIANFLSGLVATKAKIDPNDYTFKDGKDAYNFVQDFVKNTSEGKLSDRAKKLADAGKDIKTEGKMSLSSIDSAKVNDLYETQGEASLLDVVDLMKPTSKGLAQRFRSRPKFTELQDILQDEILSGERGIMEVAMGYPAYVKKQKEKGEKPAPLSGYLNNSFSTKTGFKRYIEIADRVLGKDEQSQFTQELTEAADAIGTEVTQEKEVKTKPKPKLRKDLKLQDNIIDKIKSAVVKTFGTKLPSVKSPKFKQELEKQFRTELKPVIAKMMGRTDSYETFLRDNFEAIYKALPQEIINKRFRDFANPVMKDGKQVREKTAQGNAMFTKKKITKAEFIKYFLGSNVGRSTQGTRKTALAEALSQELALDATMEVIQNPGVLEKAIAISQLVDGDFTVDGVSLNIKRPKGVKFSVNQLQDFNDTVAGQLTLVNAFQTNEFNKRNLKQYNDQTKSYDFLLKKLGVPPFKMKTDEGRKAFLDYAYTSGLISKLPKAFWRSMQGSSENLIVKDQDKDFIEDLKKDKNVGDLISDQTSRGYKGNLPFLNVIEADAWIKSIEDGKYEIDGKTMPSVKFADINSVSPNIMAAVSGTKYTNMKTNGKQSFSKIETPEFQAEQDKSIEGLKEIFLIFDAAIKADKNAAAFVGALLSSTSSNQGHFIRTSAPIRFYTNNLNPGKDGIKFVEEHSLPASSVAKYLFGLAINGTVEANFKGIKNNYYQGALNKIDDRKLKGKMLNGLNYNYESGMPLGWMINDQTWARYFNINVGNNNGGIDPASIIWHDGKSIAAKTGVNSFGFILKGENKINEKKVKNDNSKLSRSIPADASISKQLNIMSNIDKTMKLARSIDTPEKGISVFDFDDTLARTNSKILVTMPDGKKTKIDATEFAKRDAELTAKGAKYDFSEFNKVVDGKKGPLADLALKRQGKFGSKNIFVLTARPQLAAEAIKKFLDGIGLSLPLANITGLENGSPQAKADWVLSKTAEGYNDFYFADDAIKNVKAVKNILDKVDVKSDVQLAKFSKSKDLNIEFNKIIEDATGIADYKSYSNARARTIGRNKTSGWFIPPQAEDFVGLLYSLLGKGKTGDAGMKFFKEKLLDPFNKAESSLTQAKISIANDFKALKKQFKNIPKTLKKEAFDGFTYADAVRVYIWSQQGMEIPGLSKRDVTDLIEFIQNDDQLRQFAQGLQMIQKDRMYPEPGTSWLAGTITTDIIGGIDTVVRADYLQEWQENVDIMFSNENLNKLEAAYGQNYREALENVIARMKSGSNRQASSSRVVNEITDWLNNSVGAIMFFNTRSAILQTISSINFVNYSDNNILKAGLAFANQPQYWKDFNRLFNSEYLVARRNGLKINVNESEIADAVKDAKNKPKAAIAYLLKKGFLPTQIADSFAIASGGATFYRNRIKTYLKEGLTQQEAETKAFEDFYAISEETQQSSRTDRISQEQSSIAGRVILAFANTPQQYARKSKKDFLDLINGRGGPGAWKGQIGRIIYYQGAQNLLFNALQNALFAMMFDDEEEISDKKAIRIANGMADSTLRGMGIYGAAGATFKNIILKLYNESEKKNPKYEDAALEMLSFSPPLDSKVTKFRSALRTFSWDSEEIAEKGFSLDNPALLAGSQVLSAFTNIPLDRVVKKYNNLDRAFQKDTETWESTAMILGWSEWEVMGSDKEQKKKVSPEVQYLIDKQKKKNKTKKKSNRKSQ